MSVSRPTRVEIDLAALRHNFQEVQRTVELRKLGVKQPILVLGGFFPGQEADIIEHRLTPVLYDLDCARRLDAMVRDAGHSLDYHLKVDTGMGRLGFRVDRLEEVLPVLKNL